MLQTPPPDPDLSDPAVRSRAERAVFWGDHGVLRMFWHNFAPILPGAYRSNHPTHARLSDYRALGIKAILNLRGPKQTPGFLLEQESCKMLGLELVNVALAARKPAPRADLLDLFDAFDRIPRPFLMHCKSGADRAGLAAALYVLDQGGDTASARAQLSLRFLHLKFTKTGVQDHMLDLFDARQARGSIAIRDWIRAEYDPEALARSFARKRVLPV